MPFHHPHGQVWWLDLSTSQRHHDNNPIFGLDFVINPEDVVPPDQNKLMKGLFEGVAEVWAQLGVGCHKTSYELIHTEWALELNFFPGFSITKWGVQSYPHSVSEVLGDLEPIQGLG